MGIRQERLADEIRDVLARLFVGDQIRDPALEGLTITHVKLTKDLQQATVYYRSYMQNKQEEILKGLERSAGFLRTQISKAIKIRKVPQLTFVFDESVETGSKIEKILSDLKNRS